MLHWGLLSAALCFRHSRSFNRIMVAFNTEKPSLWTLACAYVCLYWLGFRFLHVQHLFTLIIKWINSFCPLGSSLLSVYQAKLSFCLTVRHLVCLWQGLRVKLRWYIVAVRATLPKIILLTKLLFYPSYLWDISGDAEADKRVEKLR